MLRPMTVFAALLASTLACQGAALAQAPAVAPAPANAQQDSDEVLAENAQTRLTRADYDADIQRLPAEMRDEFANDKKRLATYLTNLLVVKTLAADARKAGLENDPVLQRRIALEVDRALASRKPPARNSTPGRPSSRSKPRSSIWSTRTSTACPSRLTRRRSCSTSSTTRRRRPSLWRSRRARS